MLKAMNLRVRCVVLSGAWVQAHDLLDRWYSYDCDFVHHSKWRDVCDTLILDSVAVWLPYANTISVVVGKEVLDVRVDVGVEVLEKCCPEVCGPELDVWRGSCARFEDGILMQINLIYGRYNVNISLRMSAFFRIAAFHEQYHLALAYQPWHPSLVSRLTVWALTGQKRIPCGGDPWI